MLYRCGRHHCLLYVPWISIKPNKHSCSNAVHKHQNVRICAVKKVRDIEKNQQQQYLLLSYVVIPIEMVAAFAGRNAFIFIFRIGTVKLQMSNIADLKPLTSASAITYQSTFMMEKFKAVYLQLEQHHHQHHHQHHQTEVGLLILWWQSTQHIFQWNNE